MSIILSFFDHVQNRFIQNEKFFKEFSKNASKTHFVFFHVNKLTIIIRVYIIFTFCNVRKLLMV